MSEANWLPDWVKKQAKLKPGDPGFRSKYKLIGDFGRDLMLRGERVTYPKVRTMLGALGRGYRTSPGEIYEGLRYWITSGKLPRYPNGRRIRVGDKTYRSLRATAKGEHCRVGTVRARIESKTPGWSYLDQ
jgi:hypothetical protein